VQFLLDKGLSPNNTVNKPGYEAAISVSASQDFCEITNLLLKKGADLVSVNDT
jgi:hypothetical protein